jgi:hypothetical protein
MSKPTRPTIRVTKDYSLFEASADNRQVHLRKHKKLGASMKQYGFLPYWPVVVHRNGTSKMKILDGQHRLAFAESQSLPVYYIEADLDFDIAEINNTQKTWQLIDYVEVFSSQGKKDYDEALAFSTEHKLCLGRALAVLAGNTSVSAVKDDVERGTYKVKDREYAQRVASAYCPAIALEKSIRKDAFLDACMAACRVDEFEPARFIHGAKKRREKLVNYADRDSFLQMMEDIYNHGRRQLFPLRIKAIEMMRSRKASVPRSK